MSQPNITAEYMQRFEELQEQRPDLDDEAIQEAIAEEVDDYDDRQADNDHDDEVLNNE